MRTTRPLQHRMSLVCAGMLAVNMFAGVRPVLADNYLHLSLFRIDNPAEPGDAFFASLNVVLEDVPGVTDVTFSIDGSPPESLEENGPGNWNIDGSYPSFAEMIAQIDGEYTIEIHGASPSVSTFTVDAVSLEDGDFYDVPFGLDPPHGAINVPPDVILSWNDPTGPDTPYGIFLYVGNDDLEQEDSSYAGTMEITDTTWDPPLDLAEGGNEFGIGYFALGDDALISPLSVQSGAIVWSNSPFAPDGWPDATPLFVLGSQAYSFFMVGCAPDLSGDGTVNVFDLLDLLSAWGDCPGCDADLNGDDVVNVFDLLDLLAAWGPCA
jgi:hypothetical protein